MPLHIDEHLHLNGIVPVDIKKTTSSTVYLLFLSEYFDILQTISAQLLPGGDPSPPSSVF